VVWIKYVGIVIICVGLLIVLALGIDIIRRNWRL